MKQPLSSYFITIIVVIFVPFIMTTTINGRKKATENEIKSISTGRDVLINRNGQNVLIDVEEYVAAVLPGEVDPNLDKEILEAQAVAVRTKVYFAMGEKTVIDATTLDYTYYDDSAYIKRWGRENYKTIKEIYEQAVLNTKGKIIK